MRTAVAAPADDGRERLLKALQALLQQRLRLELFIWEAHREALQARRALHRYDQFEGDHMWWLCDPPHSPHAGGREL